MKEICYDVLIITNRNYGLYCAYGVNVLGLTVYVVYVKGYKEKKMPEEPTLWKEEVKESYMEILEKMKIKKKEVFYKDLFYSQSLKENLCKVSFLENGEVITCSNIIFALSFGHIIGGKQRVLSNVDFSFKPGFYMIGENGIYDNKIYRGEIYFGEANLVSQLLYQKKNNSEESITLHSTEIEFPI